MTKGPSKQRCVRFKPDLDGKIEQMAESEGRNFSQQVAWLVRLALADRAFTQPRASSDQQQRSAAM